MRRLAAGRWAAFPMMQQFRGSFPASSAASSWRAHAEARRVLRRDEGVLVVQAPENDAFKLEDGDVIQSIDGRKPEDGAHALRILRSYQSGEKLNLSVLRQRKPVTLAVTMPERPDFGDDIFMRRRCRPCRRCRRSPPAPGATGRSAATLITVSQRPWR